MIPGGGLASVFLMDKFDARIFFGVIFGDLIGIVSGAIIYEDNLKILVSLVDDGI